jgi:DNA-binding NarL/FixJ family response regulator
MHPTLIIADDHCLFAEGLRSMLNTTYDVVGMALNGRELTELAFLHKPDLIITDVSMPLLNGLDAIQLLTEKGLRSKFLVLTMHLDMSFAVQAFGTGASAFVLKTSTSEQVKEALRVVYRGGLYLSPHFPCDLVTVLAEAARRPASNRGPQLTRRQREVLQLVGEGKTMKEISAELKISTRTAESYKYHLMDVLAVRTSAELVHYAIKIGLITIKPFGTAA